LLLCHEKSSAFGSLSHLRSRSLEVRQAASTERCDALTSVLEIIAPDLLDELARQGGAAEPATSQLSTVLARANERVIEAPGYLVQTLALCGIDCLEPGSLPPAEVSAVFDLGAREARPILRADPVYMRADTSRVYLFDADSIGLDSAEADLLLELLNDAFGADNLRFRRGVNATRWYVEGAPAPTGVTYSPFDLRGQALEPSLLAMRDMGDLKRLMTEAQMLLHECAVNEVRVAAGKAPVNSIWFWGAGKLPAARTAAIQHLLTEDDLAAACAEHAGIVCGRDLGALDSLLGAAVSALGVVCAASAPGGTLDRFLDVILNPALTALRQQRLAHLTLHTRTARYDVTRRSQWRVWRSAGKFTHKLALKNLNGAAP
jgi:hypothetical protein